MPRWATASQGLGDRLRRAHRLDHVGEAAHQHDVGLAPDHPGADQGGQLLEVGVRRGRSSPRGRRHRPAAASAWWGCRASTVTGHRGKRPLSAATVASPMMPAPTTSTGSPSSGGARSRPWQAIETGSCRQAARSGTASGIGCSIEAWASTCSAHPPPRFEVNPSVRPLLTILLSRLRQDDVHPRAQLRTGRIDAPGQARDARVDGHPGPHRMRAAGPGLDHTAGDLVAQHEGERPHARPAWGTGRCCGRTGGGRCRRSRRW